MVREKYPNVLLENCASGGLRIDLGMLRHLHLTFLSDPDYSAHGLQLMWGATAMLHPSACLHWSWSQTRDTFTFNVDNNPVKSEMPIYKFDYIIRNSMLSNFGYSYRLPEFPKWCMERLEHHTKFYKETVCRFIRDADIYRLTGQVLRDGGGDRWNAYLYVAEDKNDAIMFVFRTACSKRGRVIKLKGLNPDDVYNLNYEDSRKSFKKTGRELMESGLAFDSLEEESSEIIVINSKSLHG
jgi:alpha-galactosidase